MVLRIRNLVAIKGTIMRGSLIFANTLLPHPADDGDDFAERNAVHPPMLTCVEKSRRRWHNPHLGGRRAEILNVLLAIPAQNARAAFRKTASGNGPHGDSGAPSIATGLRTLPLSVLNWNAPACTDAGIMTT